MNVYVETNFVLELVLAQEQRSSCEALLRLGEEGRARILLPAYSLAEPYEMLKRSRQRRSHVNGMLEREIASVLVHLGRETSPHSCFLSRDKDFDDPNLMARLRQHGCKLLSRFDDGAGYVQSVLSRGESPGSAPLL